MFALRGIAVSLTFFVLLYCLLSALVAVAWRSLNLLHAREQSLASLLFALRVLPLVASAVITFVFVVPSFQLLEPRSINVDEGIGAMPFALGICALLLIACGCFRVITAQTRTSRVVARWLEGARLLNVGAGAQTVTFCSRREAPPLTLVGVRRPRVLVSEATVALLSHQELHIALKHELAHMRSHDNLKKLVFRFCPFPGMARLESVWSQTAELAADGGATTVSIGKEAALLQALEGTHSTTEATLIADAAAVGQGGAPALGRIAVQKAVLPFPANFRWLILPFHDIRQSHFRWRRPSAQKPRRPSPRFTEGERLTPDKPLSSSTT